MINTFNLFRFYALVIKLMPGSRKVNKNLPRGDRICLAIEELGPVFVKFAQILSTRPDLLPEDIATSLTRLQDKVPPFPGEEAKHIIESIYGVSIDRKFKKFEMESTASASVAQVHYAELIDGSEVVVKVIRPGIACVIDRDIELLHTLAKLAEKFWPASYHLKTREIVSDYDKIIHNELNLKREAANASQLKANFKNSTLIYVPKVYWEYTHKNVMVMERIYGIPIRNVDQIQATGIDMRQLAHNGVEIFFSQAFRDGFFHADMHPGNIFVAPNGQYRAVDFGIMGTLRMEDKRYLAENLLAFFNRDYRRIADAHIRAGWIPSDTNLSDFEGEIRTVCEPIFALPINEISFGTFLMDLFRVARRFEMPIQPQLVLLQKTLLNIEGLGRQIYPKLNLWETAQPFLEKWTRDQISPKSVIKIIKKELPNLFINANEIPEITHTWMSRMKNNELIFRTHAKKLYKLERDLAAQQKKIILTLLSIGLMMISILLRPDPSIFSTIPMDWIAASVSLTLLMFSLRRPNNNHHHNKKNIEK